jgi:hypothetical protein
VLLSFEDFAAIMEEHDVIPMFVNPHKSALHKQPPAFRAMSPEEREVISLLGTELNLQVSQGLEERGGGRGAAGWARVAAGRALLPAAAARNALLVSHPAQH